MKKSGPSGISLRLLKWFCKPEYHADIEGDLLEYYERRLEQVGKRKADWLLLKDVALLFRPGIIRPITKFNYINPNGMIRSYFKVGLRSLWKSKLYSSLNVTGLTFGIVCFLLIALYVFDELTFDRQHVNAERIYRVIGHSNINGEQNTVAAAGFKLAEESKNTIPEILQVTRLQRVGRANLVDPANPVPFQETVSIADEHFLQIFDFELLSGDRRTALKDPNTIVINEDLARRIFNSVDVVGKSVQFSHMETAMKITGILKNSPRNSSFAFTSIMSESTYYGNDFYKEVMASDWVSSNFCVFALLQEDADPAAVSKKITDLAVSRAELQPGTTVSYDLQRLTDIHLHSENIVDAARNSNVESVAQGNPMYIKIFSFVAIFVLLIAGINYTNLTTARASNRIKEIGVRKTIGAVRSNLIGQFLVESLLTTVISFVLAVLIVYLLLPSYNNFVNKGLSLAGSLSYKFWLVAIALIIFVGLLSGSYAALLLSRFNPVTLLKGLKVQSMGDLAMRKGLVIFQFAISTIMIIGTVVLLLQVRFMSNTDLGFNKDLMVVIDVNVGRARSNFEFVKNEMSKIPSVKSVSVTSRVPGEWKIVRQVKLRNEGSTGDYLITYAFGADKDFLSTYEMKLLKGRNFMNESDSMSIILNETAARMLNITEPEGQVIEIAQMSRTEGAFTPLNQENEPFKPRVVGIVKDFHFQSLREKIQPLILAYNNNPIHVIDYYSVRISPVGVQETLDKLKAVMVANDAQDPFEYHFLDDQLTLFYIEDERRQTILTWTALATVFIACLGLFGLATYSAEQRLKEIAVRKVLGATVFSLTSLLSKEFVKLVLIANCVAFPIAWWATNRWLQEYAYHINVGWWIYVAAAIFAGGIALVTVSYQAIRAAVTNPVNVLKSE
jgi:putative ABC transport system permease protein